MVSQVQVHIPSLESTSCNDLLMDCSGYYVPGGEIFRTWCVVLHEPFAIPVKENSSLAPCTFRDEDVCTEERSGMELHKLHVL